MKKALCAPSSTPPWCGTIDGGRRWWTRIDTPFAMLFVRAMMAYAGMLKEINIRKPGNSHKGKTLCTIGVVSDELRVDPQCGKCCGRRTVGSACAKPAYAKHDDSAGRGPENKRGCSRTDRVPHRRRERNVSAHCVIAETSGAPSFVSV